MSRGAPSDGSRSSEGTPSEIRNPLRGQFAAAQESPA